MNVALRLAILRTVRTQTRLAAETGITEARISKIVNGWQTASADERKRICEVVGETPAALFAESDVLETSVAAKA